MGIACKQIPGLVISFLLLTAIVSGQPKGKIEYYSTEHGLSHKRVTCMLRDREGFMWFGSWDGINRFNGREFVSYKSSPGDSSHFKNDRIDQILEDESGFLWVKAYDNQVYRFNKQNEQFLPLSGILSPDGSRKFNFYKIFSANNGFIWLQSMDEGLFCLPTANVSNGSRFFQYKKDGPADYALPSNTINILHEDSDKQIWIGTVKGLRCLERSSGIYKNKMIVTDSIAQSANIVAVEEDANFLYFSTADGNLVFYNKKSKNFNVRKITTARINALLRSKKREIIYATTSKGEIIAAHLNDQGVESLTYRTSEPLHSLYEDRAGYVWIEPQKSGVIRLNLSDSSFRYYSQKTDEGFNPINNRLQVLEDNSGLLWINMKGGGFGYYNPDNQEMEYFLNTPDAAGTSLPQIIYNTFYDKTGILWLTTYERELVKIILQGSDFKQQFLTDRKTSVSDNEVRSIFYDNKDRLWLGSKSGKLHVYQYDKKITNLFENEPKEGLGFVYSIMQDSRGNIWLGTKGNGLYKATAINKEGTKYRLAHFFPGNKDSDGLNCKDIYTLLEDRSGRIWIGSFDNGLTLAVDDGYSTKFINTGDFFKSYPKEGFKRIRHMTMDRLGNIWIGSTDGLLLLNLNDPSFRAYGYTTYRKIPGDEQSLGNNDIQYIYRDRKDRMWVATSGGGFCQAIGNNPFKALHFRNYTTRDGMPNDYILSCIGDNQGNLWIATENGLSKFHPEKKLFRNYDVYDGLPKAGFSEAAVCQRLKDGQLFFGSIKGYLSFDPAGIGKNRIDANITFTSLHINNEEAGPGRKEMLLEKNINYISELALKYNLNIISIDYAILDYRAGSRQAFAYRLLGFDTTWHDDRQLRRATYTNLPSGDYVFEVKSLSSDLYSNQPYRRLAITILPPPWKTGWAYLLYVLFIGVLLFFIRRNALAMMRLRNKIALEQKLAALKLNFFTNVSHELRTPLTLIVNPLEELSKKEKLTPEGTSYLDVARKNAARMVRFINQLLDLRKVQSDKATLRISRVEVVTFVKKICSHFTEAANSKRIKLDISSDQKELVALIDAEKIDVVVYNLIGNAVKFTPEGKIIKIMIRSIPEQHSFSIAVNDQGPGVEKENLEEIFELFHEGNHPATRELKGTGIGLTLSREFVNLHGGRIWATNNEYGGLTVTMKLKLGAEHYKQDEFSFVDLPNTPVVHLPPYTTSTQDQQARLVLLVEDNDELRSFLKGQLSEFYRVETASDGKEGFEKAVTLFPDLIVSDIMMPVMDGIQLLDKVKNDVNTSHIPVVLLSAKYSIDSQIEGLKYGADYYITKPFNNEFLVASIDNLLRQRKKLFESLVEKKKTIDLAPEQIVVTSRDELFLKEVIQVVENKMDDAAFNIDMVAGSMAMSRTTFYRKFKSLTGFTPVEFVRDMRLQRAKQYLDAGGNNVSEIAYMVGFSNPKYFSTCFKEKYQVSPSDYQKAKI